jgi:hypothetical protein
MPKKLAYPPKASMILMTAERTGKNTRPLQLI